jgi:hypothetical protein
MKDIKALIRRHPEELRAPAPLVDTNDKAWGLMYRAITEGIGASPDNFQLIYPFTTWDWPTPPPGKVSATQWDFTSVVPQWSATGAYVSSGVSFNDSYRLMLDVVAAETTNPPLQKAIHEAEKELVAAQNAYDLTYSSAKSAYFYDTGGSNNPSFTVWLGTPGGRSWASRLDADWTAVEAAQRVYNDLASQTTTPGLKSALGQYTNTSYYTEYLDPSLSQFPKVPAYSIGTTSSEWLRKVQNGGGTPGSISFSNAQQQYDYKRTWAGGSTSVGNFFWSVNVGGSWERIDTFAQDQSLSATVSFKAWDQVSIQAGRWLDGAFVRGVQNGPFKSGFSPYGTPIGTKAVWGESGIMTLQKTNMFVCYKPSFEIKVSKSSFESFFQTWEVSAGVRIGPFQFSGGGGGTTDNWKADQSTLTFSGTSTAETALIMGVSVAVINPKP